MSTARWSSADLNRGAKPQNPLVTNPRTPRQATTPAEGQAFNSEAENAKKETVREKAHREARTGVRWYSCPASNEGTQQVKFAGVPDELVPQLVAAAAQLFPDLQRY